MACLPEELDVDHRGDDGPLVDLPDGGNLLVLCIGAHRLHPLHTTHHHHNHPVSAYVPVSFKTILIQPVLRCRNWSRPIFFGRIPPPASLFFKKVIHKQFNF